MDATKNDKQVMNVRTEWIVIAVDNYLRLNKLTKVKNKAIACEIQFHRMSLKCDKILLNSKMGVRKSQFYRLNACKKKNTNVYS